MTFFRFNNAKIKETNVEDLNNKTLEEILISEINNFRSKFDELSLRQKKEYETKLVNDKEKIERARKLIKETQLGTILCVILKEIWHSSSLKMTDNVNYHHKLPVILKGSSEVKNSDTVTKTFIFEYEDKTYNFIFEELESFIDREKWGYIRIFLLDKLVLEITVHQKCSGDYNDFDYTDVEKLIFGDWIKDFVEIDSKLRLLLEKESLENEFKSLKKKSENIIL